MAQTARFLGSLQQTPWLQAPRLSKKGRALAVKYLEALNLTLRQIEEREKVNSAKAYDLIMTTGLRGPKSDELQRSLFVATEALGAGLQEYAVLALGAHHCWSKQNPGGPKASPFKALIKLYRCGYGALMTETSGGHPLNFVLSAKEELETWMFDAPSLPLSSALPLFQNLH